MSEIATSSFKAKKSVALSGVTAGNTALCSVGRTGNDLHYRGYDILDIAEVCEFEEIAHLLVHGKLPTAAELLAYKARLKAMRGLSASVKIALEQLPAAAHPMDVMRTGVSALGCVLPEKDDHNVPGARDIADRLMASLGSMLLYWYHWSANGKRIDVETDDDSIGGHFLHLLHGRKPSDSWVRAMHTSLNLYAEHEFNASTFTRTQAWRRQRGRLRDPEALRPSRRCRGRHPSPRRGQGSRDRLRPPGLHRQRSAQRRHQGRGPTPVQGGGFHQDVRHRGTARERDVGRQEDVPQPRLVQRRQLPRDGRAHRDVHAVVRHLPHVGLGGARDRAAHRQQDHSPERELHRTGRPAIPADRRPPLSCASHRPCSVTTS
jgi:hypothetical protein